MASRYQILKMQGDVLFTAARGADRGAIYFARSSTPGALFAGILVDGSEHIGIHLQPIDVDNMIAALQAWKRER